MIHVMILAAGLGTRMKSRRAKVLHELGGAPLVAHVVSAALELAPEAVFTVVGHQADEVEAAVRKEAARGEQARMPALPGASAGVRKADAREEQARMPALPVIINLSIETWISTNGQRDLRILCLCPTISHSGTSVDQL